MDSARKQNGSLEQQIFRLHSSDDEVYDARRCTLIAYSCNFVKRELMKKEGIELDIPKLSARKGNMYANWSHDRIANPLSFFDNVKLRLERGSKIFTYQARIGDEIIKGRVTVKY